MFNIIEKRNILFAIPCAIIIVGIICFFIFGGLNTDIDFTGGTAMEIDLGEKFDENAVRDAVAKVEGVKVSSVQSSGANKAILKTAELPHETLVKVQDAVKAAFPNSEISSVDSVDATMGREMWLSAVKAIALAVVLMLAYIWFRFELYSGISAVLALCHDVIIIIAFYAIFQFPVNSTFIAAILTILGYSINATIVVFDRVRENYAKAKRLPFEDTVNKSIFQTLGRSICTTITTLLPVIMLFALGVSSIRQFTLTLIIGLVAGTYSSVFLAGSVWAWLKGIQDKMKAKKAQKR